ncbi:hypothetical protein L596_009873 [Steinernema carpocapsae]|uniref:Fork-head domain-containing protein n=1 Tax=Steinernema carpocapsae TaxID=34508 RepID=A0A4U5PH47_STECR|nr:hypothetical protein L596_009873 [Steinernema carpocapsae]
MLHFPGLSRAPPRSSRSNNYTNPMATARRKKAPKKATSAPKETTPAPKPAAKTPRPKRTPPVPKTAAPKRKESCSSSTSSRISSCSNTSTHRQNQMGLSYAGMIIVALRNSNMVTTSTFFDRALSLQGIYKFLLAHVRTFQEMNPLQWEHVQRVLRHTLSQTSYFRRVVLDSEGKSRLIVSKTTPGRGTGWTLYPAKDETIDKALQRICKIFKEKRCNQWADHLVNRQLLGSLINGTHGWKDAFMKPLDEEGWNLPKEPTKLEPVPEEEDFQAPANEEQKPQMLQMPQQYDQAVADIMKPYVYQPFNPYEGLQPCWDPWNDPITEDPKLQPYANPYEATHTWCDPWRHLLEPAPEEQLQQEDQELVDILEPFVYEAEGCGWGDPWQQLMEPAPEELWPPGHSGYRLL